VLSSFAVQEPAAGGGDYSHQRARGGGDEEDDDVNDDSVNNSDDDDNEDESQPSQRRRARKVVHVQLRLPGQAALTGDKGIGGVLAAARGASPLSWDTTPELQAFCESGGLRAATRAVRNAADAAMASHLDDVLTMGTCATSEACTRDIIHVRATAAN
jgi:hypothetical protein